MSEFDSWLAGRRPASPFELAAAVREKLSGVDERGSELADTLSEAAKACLRRVQARGGRAREAAFDLLAADALVTYACEAALAADDPDAALIHIARIGEGS